MLKKFNDILTLVVFAASFYLLIFPFMPAITYYFDAEVVVADYSGGSTDSAAMIPAARRLIIPAIKLDTKVHAGDVRALNKGVWHRPLSSTPTKGSNTVLAGHRFTYSDPAVFYHLDKIKLEDKLLIAWDGRLYTYTVENITVARPIQVEFEAPTTQQILTIYTCTPLWTSKNRLVIQARLVSVSS